MKKSPENDPPAERPDPDLSKGIRGNYCNRLAGANLAIIAPDLHETFPTSEAVNKALRSLKAIADRTRKAS